MTVIEVDGTSVQPLPIDAVQLFAGACTRILLFVLLINPKQDNVTPLL